MSEAKFKIKQTPPYNYLFMKKRYIAIIGILLLYFLAKMQLSNSIAEKYTINANQVSLNLDKKD